MICQSVYCRDIDFPQRINFGDHLVSSVQATIMHNEMMSSINSFS